MISRSIYLEQLIKLIGTAPIKVVTGVRRCGKSTLLDLFEEYLLQQETPPELIIRMNFEWGEFEHIKDYREISAYVEARLPKNGMAYVLLDEVQQIPGWERAVNALRAGSDSGVVRRKKTDIYLTGSNAYMGSILENIVYLELLRRGCQVFVGRLPPAAGVSGDMEVDFVALRDGIATYYQVTTTMLSPEVAERELRPLRAIKDNYEKIVLSLDDMPFNDYEGIKQMNVIRFLLEPAA